MQTSVAAALADDPDDPRILGDLYGRVLPTRALVADRFEDLPALLDTSMEHVRRAPPTTSVYPGRVLWALLHAAADGDLGAGPRAELAAHVDATGMALFELGLELVDAVILGRRGDRESASATFDAARTAALSRQMHHGMTHAHAVIVSEAALRDGWGDPVPALRSAEAFFVDGGYDALARRCRRMLAQAGAAPPRRGRGDSEVPASLRALGVTSREVDVLKRVAAGRTNKQIASDLVLSPKTVERHISSLFDRTGVRSRTALIAVAAEHLGADVGDGIR
jgi:DNA-binding CsgD family transcriptional regulator